MFLADFEKTTDVSCRDTGATNKGRPCGSTDIFVFVTLDQKRVMNTQRAGNTKPTSRTIAQETTTTGNMGYDSPSHFEHKQSLAALHGWDEDEHDTCCTSFRRHVLI